MIYDFIINKLKKFKGDSLIENILRDINPYFYTDMQKDMILKLGACAMTGDDFNEDRIYATVEEIKNEYEKLNLPRKFDRVFLEDSIRNIKRYNLVQVADKLVDMDAKIQIYPSVMLAMPDTDISKAYDETVKLLSQYENSEEEDEE